MKRAFLLLIACATSLHAGIPSAKGGSAKTEIVPVEDPLFNWFAGGSAGYLLDNETGMFTGHLGVDLPWKVAGFGTALFGEIGWAQGNGSYGTPNQRIPTISSDIHLLPLTINVKLERPLFGPVNFYLGGGAGAAIVDLEMGNNSSDDTVFFAQAFTGLVTNIGDHFEVFAGARWIHLDQPNFGNGMDLGDFGFSNDDVFLEAGGRLNF